MKIEIYILACLLIIFKSTSAQKITNEYDNLGRLKKVQYPDSSIISYTYDASGNRITTLAQNICFTKPNPTITANSNLTFCAGDSVVLTSSSSPNYAWSNGGTTRRITVKQSGKYFVTAKYFSTCSKVSDTITVTVRPKPTAKITPSGSTVFCMGDSVILVSDVANNYRWSTGSTSRSIVAKTSGTYRVKVTSNNGCSDSTQVRVTANPNPVVNTGGNKSLCIGSSVVLGAAPVAGHTYSWQPSNALSNATIANPVANPVSRTTYSLKVTNSFGCSSTGNSVVTVNPLPVVDAGEKVALSNGNQKTIGGNPTASGNPAFRYNWTPTADLNNPAVANPVASPKVTTTYNVVVTDRNGCVASDSIELAVIPSDKRFVVFPNPSSGIVNIIGASVENGNWHIRLINNLGQVVFSDAKVQASNRSLFYKFSIGNLAAGVYYVTIDNNITKETVPILKH